MENIDYFEFYKDWQMKLGKKLENNRKYFIDNILMPDGMIQLIRDFSLGKFLDSIKDPNNIDPNNIISLYTIEKRLSDNGNGGKKTLKMKDCTEKYFNNELIHLGLKKENNKIELAEPKNIANIEKLENIKKDSSKFTNYFREYLDHLEDEMNNSTRKILENNVKKYNFALTIARGSLNSYDRDIESNLNSIISHIKVDNINLVREKEFPRTGMYT